MSELKKEVGIKRQCKNCHYRNKETGYCFKSYGDIVDEDNLCDLHMTGEEWREELLEYMKKANRFLKSFGWQAREAHQQIVALIKKESPW